MSQREEDLDPASLRELADKCRRLASDMNDAATVAALRQMAIDYDRLAYGKERQSQAPAPEMRDS
jgi:hypothetical protein